MSEMCSTSQQYCLRWNNHRSNLLTVFDELLQNEAFTDVTLACEGGTSIKCHKVVLAACSSYFQNLFTDLPCSHPVVVLKDVKYTEIKAILEYMYRGEVNVAQNQLAGLLKVAETLKVKGLVEEKRPCMGSASPLQPEKDLHCGPQSPPRISTSSAHVQSAHSSSVSPPHSTGSSASSYHKPNPYGQLYSKPPPVVERDRERVNLPLWVPGLPLPHHSPGVVPPPSHPASLLSGSYEAVSSEMSPLKRKKLSSLLMNRDTPILRTVLGQGQADSSQPVSLVCHPDSHHENGTPQDLVKMKNEPLEDAQSPYTEFMYSSSTGPTAADDDEKVRPPVQTSSPQPYASSGAGTGPGLAPYVPQKPEWKRYKQYTRNDILSAIEAVRNGMSALQAARKYGVPSRTLYDKVKKLGITTSRPFKRGSNGSSACFPYGLSGTSSPYGTDPDEQAHAEFLERSLLQHALDNRDRERETTAKDSSGASGSGSPGEREGDTRSPSPSPAHAHKYPSPDPHHMTTETNGSDTNQDDDDNNQVEDLSVNRKTEPILQPPSRVIMSPLNILSSVIKKEDILREDIRREVSLEDAE